MEKKEEQQHMHRESLLEIPCLEPAEKTTLAVRGVECALFKWVTPREDQQQKGVVVVYHGFGAHSRYPTVRYASSLLAGELWCCVIYLQIGICLISMMISYIISLHMNYSCLSCYVFYTSLKTRERIHSVWT